MVQIPRNKSYQQPFNFSAFNRLTISISNHGWFDQLVDLSTSSSYFCKNKTHALSRSKKRPHLPKGIRATSPFTEEFLNAMLPLDVPIRDLEYLPADMVPEIPLLKHSIVDVRCVDEKERQFIVEMQMLWTDSFKSRVLLMPAKLM